MAEKIREDMTGIGVNFINLATPTKIEKNEATGKLNVFYMQDGEEKSEEYDTVLSAIGRTACTKDINLENAGVVAESNGKIKADEFERTNVDNIFAIGDVIYGILELTPTAIQAGKLLARRLYNNGVIQMNYKTIPTTVFTPMEYGTAGLSEEELIAEHGEDNIEVYHQQFQPLEYSYDKGRNAARFCYIKIITNRNPAVEEQDPASQKVLGFHVLCPNAGEVTQGMGLAMKCGVTKLELDETIGIHPTIAEEMVGLSVTKRMDPDAAKTSC